MPKESSFSLFNPEQMNVIKRVLQLAAFPRRGTSEKNVSVQELAEMIQKHFTVEDLEVHEPKSPLAGMLDELDALVCRESLLHDAIHREVYEQVLDGKMPVLDGHNRSWVTLNDLSEREFYDARELNLQTEEGENSLVIQGVKDPNGRKWVTPKPILTPANAIPRGVSTETWQEISQNVLALRRGEDLILEGPAREAAVATADWYRFDPIHQGAGLRVLAVFNFDDELWETSHHISGERLRGLIEPVVPGVTASEEAAGKYLPASDTAPVEPGLNH